MSHVDMDEWRQVNLWFHDAEAAENAAVARLRPQMAAESAVAAWWFTRKSTCWRLRYLPVLGRDAQADTVIRRITRRLVTERVVTRWVRAIYEPEVAAFGGNEAMRIAHRLFAADSRHILTYLQQCETGRSLVDHRRELGLLLASILMRAAGCDWYERGDIWTRVAAHRALGPLGADAVDRAIGNVKRLITARAHASGSPLAIQPEWPDAFAEAGRRLAELADQGRLTRGLRAVIAHHVLFAWNRAGLPANQQACLAAAAAHVIFHTDPDP